MTEARPGSSFLFNEAIARVTVVVDPVFRFQFLDVSELASGVRAGDAVTERLAGVQQISSRQPVRLIRLCSRQAVVERQKLSAGQIL
ncbi:MAG TPA: hypothetical protein VJ885_19475 [Thermoanaerobaculia bacterium]|nr:hypothetical protein [Thermoanaerobaculia bacterium]